ncbi:MAG: MFS transporter, partial [Pseudomonadota bacterium]
ELVGSMTYIAETSPKERRGYFTSWSFASGYCGMMLGSLSAVILNLLLGPTAMSEWGWRLPFLFGIVIGAVAIWMRTELEETPVFEKMKAEGKIGGNPLALAIDLAPWGILHAILLVILTGGGFYLLFIWWPTLLSRFIHPHVPYAMALNTLSIMLLIFLIPIAGRLSDELGRKTLLLYSTAAMTLLSMPLFLLVAQGGFLLAFVSQIIFTVIMAAYLGTIPVTLVEMFPSHIRYSAIGLSYNLSLCIFGGTAPLLATWLVKHYHNIYFVALYLVFLSALNFVAVMFLPEKKQK